MSFEFDPEVPYFRSDDVNVAELLLTHGKAGCADVMSLSGLLGEDDDDPSDITLVTGRFMPLISPDFNYSATFSPGLDDDVALAVPVVRDGQTIDALCICADNMDAWGAITGRGGMIGHFKEGQPVRIYATPWRWLSRQRDGVVVLRKDAYSPRQFAVDASGAVIHINRHEARLANASIIYAETSEHAEELLFRLFEKPSLEDSHPALASNPAFLEQQTRSVIERASKRVGIDADRYDVGAAIEELAVKSVVRRMKQEGIFG
ncbi:hypothetical protein IVA95_23445 [Bradyrhizobium sp. 157]|uniref:hypothetical protein n=1 Tax=Bradyrhizobium sp. 157 TaxID=2782631 RepID=UPI001FF9B659|nr:hypothetical protein [Bradyrhizobium sp. 157]MCK1640457.1 hypothetical protein [Bradyrhizobium sp. 157]